MSSEIRVASLRPDEAKSGGSRLPESCRVIIERARFSLYDYRKSDREPFTVIQMDLRPHESEVGELGEDLIREFWMVGQQQYGMPSMDGKSVVDSESDDPEDREGVYLKHPEDGKMAYILEGREPHRLLQSFVDSGFELEDMTPDIRWMEGLDVQMVKVDPPPRPGVVAKEGEEKKYLDKLVEKIYGSGGGSKKGKTTRRGKATKSGGSKKAAAPESADVEAAVIEAIVEVLSEDESGIVDRKKLAGAVTKKMPPKMKAKAVKLVRDTEWLGSQEEFTWDEDDDDLALTD